MNKILLSAINILRGNTRSLHNTLASQIPTGCHDLHEKMLDRLWERVLLDLVFFVKNAPKEIRIRLIDALKNID